MLSKLGKHFRKMMAKGWYLIVLAGIIFTSLVFYSMIQQVHAKNDAKAETAIVRTQNEDLKKQIQNLTAQGTCRSQVVADFEVVSALKTSLNQSLTQHIFGALIGSVQKDQTVIQTNIEAGIKDQNALDQLVPDYDKKLQARQNVNDICK
jgi:hypothetical protein